MASEGQKGQRLLANVIDFYASDDPTRVWATAPVDDEDLAKGYRNITYKDLANAINHASWWLKGISLGTAPSFSTLAYSGPNDLRYPIIAVAAIKCGKQLLLPSSTSTPEAQRHLLRATQCNTFLHASSFSNGTHTVLAEMPNVRSLEIPDLREWLCEVESRPFAYGKTWEESSSDPWLILHTSGTTGSPRPIMYTNWMITTFDAAELMPDADHETMNDHFRGACFYTSAPMSHFVGITIALQWTTFLNTTLAVAPPVAMSADKIVGVLETSKASGVAMSPSGLEGICRQPGGLGHLRRLKYIYFAGAPLSRSIAEQLIGHCKVQPGMGSTEAGSYFLQIRNDDDWEYYRFRPAMGVELEHKTKNLYELVFHRKPELERWQQVFKVFPDLDRFPTRDLWTKHPSKDNLWRYAGRLDDLIILSNGSILDASAVEAEVEKSPDVRAALIGGQGKARPFLIIEPVDGNLPPDTARDLKLAHIWPYIERGNDLCSDTVKLSRGLIMFTDGGESFPRTAKGTVSRQASFAMYQSEISRLYETSLSAS